ncbi:MAG: hypothetical protein DME26_02710, partial [Verrucomicrobia bacterium]
MAFGVMSVDHPFRIGGQLAILSQNTKPLEAATQHGANERSRIVRFGLVHRKVPLRSLCQRSKKS